MLFLEVCYVRISRPRGCLAAPSRSYPPDMNCLIPASSRGRGSRAQELGMTLAEVVVALGLASLTVAGLVGGYISSMLATEKASLSLAANTRAFERLEDTHGAIWNVASWPVVDQLVATNFPTKLVILDLSGQVFFFQAEDGIRDLYVTGVQTCALPI